MHGLWSVSLDPLSRVRILNYLCPPSWSELRGAADFIIFFNSGQLNVPVFMAFCCILSPLWSQATFHNLLHFSKEQDIMLRKPLFTAILHCNFYPALLNT